MCFRARLGNQTIDFSDFWYVTSLIYYFKYGISSFARKNYFGPKNGEKGVKNMLFRARLGNQTIDFLKERERERERGERESFSQVKNYGFFSPVCTQFIWRQSAQM